MFRRSTSVFMRRALVSRNSFTPRFAPRFYSTETVATTATTTEVPETNAVDEENAEYIEIDPLQLEEEQAIVKQVSGLPEAQYHRTVFIHQPARTAMQQGTDKHNSWKMEWERDPQYGNRWADPLMGWTASTDPLNTCYVYFASKEAAIEFAERHGYAYTVEDSKHVENPVRPGKSYAASFKYHAEDEDKW